MVLFVEIIDHQCLEVTLIVSITAQIRHCTLKFML